MSEILKPMTFAEHKDQTAGDCDAFAKMVSNLAAQVRKGDTKAFERFFIEGGTEDGDAKLDELHQRLVFRFLFREEAVSKNEANKLQKREKTNE